MSVSASVVRKIMRGSVWARNITDCLIAFGIVLLVFICGSLLMGGIAKLSVSVGPYVFTKAALEPWSVRAYVTPVLMIAGVWAIASLYLVRSVFAELARGNIFCEANVRHIRNLGWLTIAGGIYCWVMPLANAAYFMVVGHENILIRPEPPIFGGLEQVLNGGLYLLMSWIMAVGLGVREDAEELQRDAELVI